MVAGICGIRRLHMGGDKLSCADRNGSDAPRYRWTVVRAGKATGTASGRWPGRPPHMGCDRLHDDRVPVGRYAAHAGFCKTLPDHVRRRKRTSNTGSLSVFRDSFPGVLRAVPRARYALQLLRLPDTLVGPRHVDWRVLQLQRPRDVLHAAVVSGRRSPCYRAPAMDADRSRSRRMRPSVLDHSVTVAWRIHRARDIWCRRFEPAATSLAQDHDRGAG